MAEETRHAAELRTEAALRERGLRDPREQYREWLRELKETDPDGFTAARRHYEERLLPLLEAAGADPVAAWIDYGRVLAERAGAGRVVSIDATGRARDYEPAAADLVLFLPEDTARRARILSLPLQPSPAQRATCDLLVLGKQMPSTRAQA